MEAGLQRHAVSQAVRDREASAALQLGQHDDHLSSERQGQEVLIRSLYLLLPVQGRDTVYSLELAPGGHHVVRLLAVAPDLYPLVWMSVLHHHHQPRPALGQVVGRHPLPTLVPLSSETYNTFQISKKLEPKKKTYFATVRLMMESANRW